MKYYAVVALVINLLLMGCQSSSNHEQSYQNRNYDSLLEQYAGLLDYNMTLYDQNFSLEINMTSEYSAVIFADGQPAFVLDADSHIDCFIEDVGIFSTEYFCGYQYGYRCFESGALFTIVYYDDLFGAPVGESYLGQLFSHPEE